MVSAYSSSPPPPLSHPLVMINNRKRHLLGKAGCLPTAAAVAAQLVRLRVLGGTPEEVLPVGLEDTWEGLVPREDGCSDGVEEERARDHVRQPTPCHACACACARCRLPSIGECVRVLVPSVCRVYGVCVRVLVPSVCRVYGVCVRVCMRARVCCVCVRARV